MIDNRSWIVNAYDASTPFLKLDRSCPWLIYVFFWKFLKDRDPFTDIVSILIFILKKRDWRIHLPILVKESGGG